jgi:hypothetical protein
MSPHWFRDLHVHRVASTPNAQYVEIFADDQVLNFRKLVDTQLEARKGELVVPITPGLGFRLREAGATAAARQGEATQLPVLLSVDITQMTLKLALLLLCIFSACLKCNKDPIKCKCFTTQNLLWWCRFTPMRLKRLRRRPPPRTWLATVLRLLTSALAKKSIWMVLGLKCFSSA